MLLLSFPYYSDARDEDNLVSLRDMYVKIISYYNIALVSANTHRFCGLLDITSRMEMIASSSRTITTVVKVEEPGLP